MPVLTRWSRPGQYDRALRWRINGIVVHDDSLFYIDICWEKTRCNDAVHASFQETGFSKLAK